MGNDIWIELLSEYDIDIDKCEKAARAFDGISPRSVTIDSVRRHLSHDSAFATELYNIFRECTYAHLDTYSIMDMCLLAAMNLSYSIVYEPLKSGHKRASKDTDCEPTSKKRRDDSTN